MSSDPMPCGCHGHADHADRCRFPEMQTCATDLYRELTHIVRLLEPEEANGNLQVPGLATLNGARAALSRARLVQGVVPYAK